MDGTWNIPTSDTNVSRLLRLVDVDSQSDAEQRTTYIVGVGTTWNSRIRGAFGKGINGPD
ncbi:phospholipase effector Tle1 domain-containing protein [Bradyrhizobium diazoefficiens]|uniref:phospholipase effector Tle1 domain-containing protein n=1 Tax=Bradyrhizobium diazoefficiens TaxID=1355477 RepID=UPI0039772DE6